ncbi:PREDICTED: CREB/ATF bZIP transcription factor-like isoform X2 [Priapulus caudatus]|uniref:CREB/ATF bZIP transcription factor-like isoform X2 n=1 Tax=Priapulus caudatus TaxID=37621 RepID=A0ABM1ENU7_PRICU|nr:PREDICTED: CREB/ATF bZIP transcription factor-like isoform X2 [Priapulus caudatus]
MYQQDSVFSDEFEVGKLGEVTDYSPVSMSESSPLGCGDMMEGYIYNALALPGFEELVDNMHFELVADKMTLLPSSGVLHPNPTDSEYAGPACNVTLANVGSCSSSSVAQQMPAESTMLASPRTTSPLPEVCITAAKQTGKRAGRKTPKLPCSSDVYGARTRDSFSPTLSPAHSTSSEDDKAEAIVEKNQRNAQQARINREKKKAHINKLESDKEKLAKENAELRTELEIERNESSTLREELAYLRNVIANESTLSTLLKNIDASSVSLTTSFNRKRAHHGDAREPTKHTKGAALGGGVCLHVENKNVSLEFCPRCSRMAHVARIAEL